MKTILRVLTFLVIAGLCMAAVPSEILNQYYNNPVFNTNGGFENGFAFWNASSTAEALPKTDNVGFGDVSIEFDPSGKGAKLYTDNISIPKFAWGASCSTDFMYNTGASDQYEIRMMSGTSSFARKRLKSSNNQWKNDSIRYTCPWNGSVNVQFIAMQEKPKRLWADNVHVKKNKIYETAAHSIDTTDLSAGSETSLNYEMTKIDPYGEWATNIYTAKSNGLRIVTFAIMNIANASPTLSAEDYCCLRLEKLGLVGNVDIAETCVPGAGANSSGESKLYPLLLTTSVYLRAGEQLQPQFYANQYDSGSTKYELNGNIKDNFIEIITIED